MTTKSLAKENFLDFLEEKQLTAYRLSQILGVNKANIYNFIKKGTTTYGLLVKMIDHYPELREILFPIPGDQNKKVVQPKIQDINKKEVLMQSQKNGMLKPVPYYDIDIASETINFGARTDKYFSISLLSDIIAFLPMRGNSMSPLINNGDIIAIKEAAENHIIDTSLIYLIITDQNQMIKHVTPEPEKQILWCTTANPHHKPFPLQMNLLKGLYIVTAKITHL
jgi:hypothetical protein